MNITKKVENIIDEHTDWESIVRKKEMLEKIDLLYRKEMEKKLAEDKPDVVEDIISALVKVLRDKTTPGLITAIVEDLREKVYQSNKEEKK